MERISNADMEMFKMVDEENKYQNGVIFDNFKPNPLSKTHTYEGIEAYTFPIGTNFNVAQVTVGTNGYQGGDAGHGGRLFITIEGLPKGCFVAQVGEGIRFDTLKIDIGAYGDDEISMVCKCLRMIIKTVEIQLKGIEDDKKCIYGKDMFENYKFNDK